MSVPPQESFPVSRVRLQRCTEAGGWGSAPAQTHPRAAVGTGTEGSTGELHSTLPLLLAPTHVWKVSH